MDGQGVKTCLNCEAELIGAYCHKCGQSAKVRRLAFLETMQDFFSSSFALEGPLFKTIKLLIVNPGLLFREYVAGRRKKYYRPVAFFVLLTALYIIVRSVINYDPFEHNPLPTNVPESRKKLIDAARFMVKNINNILFTLVLSIAIFQKLFFFRRYNFTEYLTMSFYMVGIYILFGTLVAFFSTYVYPVNANINLVFMFFLLVYNAYSLHRSRSFWSFLRYPIVSVLSILGYMAMGYGLSFLIVYLRDA